MPDSPCDPKKLNRAARDHAEREPAFAAGLRQLTLGYGCEVTALDVWNACGGARKAAEAIGQSNEVQAIIRKLIGSERPDGFVRQVLGREVGLT